ncbi:MAG: hypothetical protein ACOYJX_05350 [Acutalibacteraceae bacterium]
MKKKLTNEKNISPSCSTCQHGKLSPNRQRILCLKKGIMLPSSHCRKYIYDPLKRQPVRPPEAPKFNPEDFTL